MLNNNHRRHQKVVAIVEKVVAICKFSLGGAPITLSRKLQEKVYGGKGSCYTPVQQLEGPESAAESHQRRISGTRLLSAEDIYEARRYITTFQPLD